MRVLLFLILIVFGTTLCAQKVLRIETVGKIKTQKLFVGDEVSYRLKGDDLWQSDPIQDLIVETGIIIFPNRYVKLEEVAAFRFRRRFLPGLGKQMVHFAGAYTAYALIVAAVDDEYSIGTFDYAVVGTAAGFGILFRTLLRNRVIRFGKRKRLRIVDLTIKRELGLPN